MIKDFLIGLKIRRALLIEIWLESETYIHWFHLLDLYAEYKDYNSKYEWVNKMRDLLKEKIPKKEDKYMKVQKFLKACYSGWIKISIRGYCEDKLYTYLFLSDREYRSICRQKGSAPACLCKEPWWNEIKNKKVKKWDIQDGICGDVATLYIELEEEDAETISD